MKITIFNEHSDLTKKKYEDILLYDWGEFRRYGNAKNISDNEVWPVGSHDKDGNVAFFVYGENGNLNGEDGGFEIKELQYNKKLGRFGGCWFKDFVYGNVGKKQDWNKPIVQENLTTYEYKYKYVWFTFNGNKKFFSAFVRNNFKKEIINNEICYRMELR